MPGRVVRVLRNVSAISNNWLFEEVLPNNVHTCRAKQEYIDWCAVLSPSIGQFLEDTFVQEEKYEYGKRSDITLSCVSKYDLETQRMLQTATPQEKQFLCVGGPSAEFVATMLALNFDIHAGGVTLVQGGLGAFHNASGQFHHSHVFPMVEIDRKFTPFNLTKNAATRLLGSGTSPMDLDFWNTGVDFETILQHSPWRATKVALGYQAEVVKHRMNLFPKEDEALLRASKVSEMVIRKIEEQIEQKLLDFSNGRLSTALGKNAVIQLKRLNQRLKRKGVRVEDISIEDLEVKYGFRPTVCADSSMFCLYPEDGAWKADYRTQLHDFLQKREGNIRLGELCHTIIIGDDGQAIGAVIRGEEGDKVIPVEYVYLSPGAGVDIKVDEGATHLLRNNFQRWRAATSLTRNITNPTLMGTGASLLVVLPIFHQNDLPPIGGAGIHLTPLIIDRKAGVQLCKCTSGAIVGVEHSPLDGDIVQHQLSYMEMLLGEKIMVLSGQSCSRELGPFNSLVLYNLGPNIMAHKEAAGSGMTTCAGIAAAVLEKFGILPQAYSSFSSDLNFILEHRASIGR